MGVLGAPAGHSEYSSASPRLIPATLLQIAVLSLIVGNMGTLPILNLGSRSAPLFVNDLCAMAVVATGAALTLRARSLRLDGAAVAALLFATIGAVSAITAIPRFGLSTFEVVGSLAYLARWLVYFGIYVVIINCLTARDIKPVWTALENLMLVFAGFGIFQSAFIPDLGPKMYPGAELYLEIDPQGHRLVSTVLEPNMAAAMIAIVLLVQIAQMAYGVPVKRWKPALLLLAFVLTLSRSGALGFLIGLMVIVAARGVSKRVLKFFVVTGLFTIAALPQLIAFANKYEKFVGFEDGSGAARLITWQRAIMTFLESPWFGIGFNTYGFVQAKRGVELFGSASYSAEGGLLFIAVLTGVVGLAVYCTMLWLVLRKCRSVWRSADATAEERALCAGGAAATITILVHSLFVNSLLTPFVMEPLWVLWGFAFLIASELRRRRAAAIAP